MICGDTRARLRERGFSLKACIPTIATGENHRVEHRFDGPRLAVTFETPAGQFIVEVVFFSNVIQACILIKKATRLGFQVKAALKAPLETL